MIAMSADVMSSPPYERGRGPMVGMPGRLIVSLPPPPPLAAAP